MDLTQGHMAWGRPTEVLGWPEALDGETQEGPPPQSPCLSGVGGEVVGVPFHFFLLETLFLLGFMTLCSLEFFF